MAISITYVLKDEHVRQHCSRSIPHLQASCMTGANAVVHLLCAGNCIGEGKIISPFLVSAYAMGKLPIVIVDTHSDQFINTLVFEL